MSKKLSEKAIACLITGGKLPESSRAEWDESLEILMELRSYISQKSLRNEEIVARCVEVLVINGCEIELKGLHFTESLWIRLANLKASDLNIRLAWDERTPENILEIISEDEYAAADVVVNKTSTMELRDKILEREFAKNPVSSTFMEILGSGLNEEWNGEVRKLISEKYLERVKELIVCDDEYDYTSDLAQEILEILQNN